MTAKALKFFIQMQNFDRENFDDEYYINFVKFVKIFPCQIFVAYFLSYGINYWSVIIILERSALCKTKQKVFVNAVTLNL